jgi:formylmethanofuran dehydrogenase subunit D
MSATRTFILITGRSTKQGRTIHFGKQAQAYLDEIGAIEMNPADMQALAVDEGARMRVRNAHGSIVLRCRKGTVPEGLVFVPYGSFVNELVGPDTQGTGMPDSKGITVEVAAAGEAGTAGKVGVDAGH